MFMDSINYQALGFRWGPYVGAQNKRNKLLSEMILSYLILLLLLTLPYEPRFTNAPRLAGLWVNEEPTCISHKTETTAPPSVEKQKSRLHAVVITTACPILFSGPLVLNYEPLCTVVFIYCLVLTADWANVSHKRPEAYRRYSFI